MGFLDRFRRKQEDESSRLARLSRTGRIVEGEILDIVVDVAGNITQVFYSYSIGGVAYHSSQTLDAEQQHRKADYSPASRVTIRYDPRQPANSIVV